MPSEIFPKKNYINERWMPEQRRFALQARLYYVFSTFMALLALITVVGALVLTSIDDQTLQIGLLGTALVIIATHMLYDFKSRARRYEGAADALRSEYEMYRAGIGIYRNPDKAFARFVRRCEAIIQASGNRYTPLLLDDDDDEPEINTHPSPPASSNPFGRGSSSSTSSLRGRLSRFSPTSKPSDGDDEDDDDEDDDEDDASPPPRPRFESISSTR
jgi:hypothetical protein